MTKKLALLLLLAPLLTSLYGQQAYTIKVTLRPFTSGYLYLGHHFGDKQYLIDSARLNDKSEAVFTGQTPLFGGVYMIIFPKKNGWLEVLIDKKQQITLSADTSDLLGKIKFANSPENESFNKYQVFAQQRGRMIAGLQQQIRNREGDSAAHAARISAIGKEMQAYRENYIKTNKGDLLAAIFLLLQEPRIPAAAQHPSGKYDSLYAYKYYRSHYWEGISFADERLIRTPVFQPRLIRYFTQVLPQVPDTLIREADRILDASINNKEMFKFLLATLTEKYVNPQYMGQDAVFVHLFEKYYAPGKADYWLTDKYRKFVFDRAYSLMANLIGEKAAPLEMVDTAGRRMPLYEVPAAYTIVFFWDPTCGHCKTEVPGLDSLYRAKWKDQGIRIYGVMVEGGKENWLNFIRENKLAGWIHVYQTEEMKNAAQAAGQPSFRQLYDVYQTPMLYLLDKDKHIIAKRLTYEQLDDFLDVKLKQPSGSQ